MTRGGRSSPVPTNRRHVSRRGCVYCGVTLRTSAHVQRKPTDADHRTWDHVVPSSCGGRLQLPACCWCNNAKGAMSVTDWLGSQLLSVRRSSVSQRDPNADPMQEKIVLQIRDEDLVRIRRETEYHAR